MAKNPASSILAIAVRLGLREASCGPEQDWRPTGQSLRLALLSGSGAAF